MPRISVVVPIYNVESYLEACLSSVAEQTVDDLEVVMVDDGSTDGSAAIAGRFVSDDKRFRLLTQPNGGLSKARNTGIDAATGDYMAFLDSDDVLPPNAYELLLGALEQSGSDFASGNVHRLNRWGTVQSPFLAKAFTQTRLKTHVTQFRELLSDRTAWNKLWRRSFWEANGLRFPEGVVHEDIPVVLPAHFMAASVDVISDPVYLYRIRDGGDLSITQRRLEQRVLLDRLAAIEHVSGYIEQHGQRRAKRWYEESVVADDLRYHLNILDSADEPYRELFLERVNGFLDGAAKGVEQPLPAIERLKWHLVRRRLMPELLEVLRFQREDLSSTPPVRSRGRWYGDYPFRTDSSLRIPRSVYRLDSELGLVAHLEELRRDGDALRIRGFAYVGGIGAPARDTQRLGFVALRPGRLRRVRLRLSGVRLKTTAVHRPDATAKTKQPLADVSWGGFEATLDPAALRTAGRWSEGSWELYASASVGRLRRRRVRFVLEPPAAFRAVELPAPADVAVRAGVVPGDRVAVEVRKQWVTLSGHGAEDGGVLVLTGEVQPPTGGKLKLELRSEADEQVRTYRMKVADGGFTARVPMGDLDDTGLTADDEADDEPGGDKTWDLWAVGGGRRIPVRLPEELAAATWPWEGGEVALMRSRPGDARLVRRDARPVVDRARWAQDGALELEGMLPEGIAFDELVLEGRDAGVAHAVPLSGDGDRFSARLTPGRVPSLAGELPLAEGTWSLFGRRTADAGAAGTPVTLARELYERLPLTTVLDGKQFALGVTRADRAVLVVGRDLADDERGQYHQRRLRETAYRAKRGEPLRDAVVYMSFGGRQYSDSPRAIHEELVRRAAPLEHLWVVRDGACRVPPSATVLREGSREYHEALARSRYFVTNDHFPDWFARRPEQVGLQTWHGTPLKRLGLDVSDMRRTIRRFQRRWDQQVANWQYVVSPNAFSTPILRRAYAVEGEMLETGYPRVDVLARPDRDELGRALRRRLGLPDDKRTVLYAPTYRDQVTDRRGRYRLDLRLDLERLRDAVGDDSVILFRKHHYIVDPAPSTADGFVRDVSAYPDGTELLLAADVLVTDYSSMMVDFANTGRPMLFFTYDLDAYRDEIRGFYLDFVENVPGPLLGTTDEVAAALQDLDGVQAANAQRYEAFRSTFCELDDGRAAARVVDRVFSR